MVPFISLSILQIVLAFISASLLRKLSNKYFFIRWLARHKFTCLVAPYDETIFNFRVRPNKDVGPSSSKGGSAGIRKRNKNQRKREQQQAKQHQHQQQPQQQQPQPQPQQNSPPKPNEIPETFSINARDIDNLNLKEDMLMATHIVRIFYANDLEWVADLGLMAVINYAITEVQFYFFDNNSNECNFSLLWALLVVHFSVKYLWKITKMFFVNHEGIVQKSTCILSALVFFFISFGLLLTEDEYFEFGIDKSYLTFSEAIDAIYNNETIPLKTINNMKIDPLSEVNSLIVKKSTTFFVAKIVISLLASFTSFIYTFPSIRFGQIQKSIIERAQISETRRFLSIINYLSPLIVVLLWVKPIGRDLFTNQDLVPMNDHAFDTFRIYIIVFVSLLRIFHLPLYVKMFLKDANHRMLRLKMLGGQVTNKDIQQNIRSVYNFINVVALQYLLPIFMGLFMALIFTTMGNHYWNPSLANEMPYNATGLPTETTTTTSSTAPTTTTNDFDSLNLGQVDYFVNITSEADKQIRNPPDLLALFESGELKKVLSPPVFRGILGYATWYIHFSWFISTTLSLMFYRVFII